VLAFRLANVGDARMMKRAILLLLLISAPAGAQIQSDSGLETANYKSVAVLVEELSADARRIGLTRDRIQTRVELRLRSAGLTPGKGSSKNAAYLYVRVKLGGSAYSAAVEYKRQVVFITGNRRYVYTATTWESANIGTHARSVVYIMNGLDKLLDEFSNAYLKANQK